MKKASGFSTGTQMLKKDYKKQMKMRKDVVKERDRKFQESIPKDAVCAVGHGCMGTLIRHHVRGRRHIKERWDVGNSVILCVSHHTELHKIGQKTFMKKYGIIVPCVKYVTAQEK